MKFVSALGLAFALTVDAPVPQTVTTLAGLLRVVGARADGIGAVVAVARVCHQRGVLMLFASSSRVRLALAGLIVTGSIACGTGKPSAAELVAAPRPASCPPLNPVAAQARAEGERLWTEGQNGEHVTTKAFDAAVAQWRVAALGGDLVAQYTLGVRIFSARFQESSPEADNEEEHDAYVEAMSWIAVAAQQGQPSATKALSPWLLQALSDPKAEVKPDAEDPLASIPTAWIREAGERAASLRGCW